jgi:ABC-type uncharacterized transport system permease subunit
MISLLIEVALFILVMFFVMPAMLMLLMILREAIRESRRQAAWLKGEAREISGKAIQRFAE